MYKDSAVVISTMLKRLAILSSYTLYYPPYTSYNTVRIHPVIHYTVPSLYTLICLTIRTIRATVASVRR